MVSSASMKLLRVVLSDLHLGTGVRPGEPNAFEDFRHDEDFEALLEHYDAVVGAGELELVLNGDIFDLLKVKIGGRWPTEVTDGIACEKLKQCLDGHPRFVRALSRFMDKERRRIVFIPGNHDLDMWLPGPQSLFRRYVAPNAAPERVHFVTKSDTYYLPDGIQIRLGHQLERIHRVDYQRMTRRNREGHEVLELPWGTLWILEVMNPAKELRSFVDRIQPLGRFLLGAVLFDTRFLMKFTWRSALYFLRWRVFNLSAWRDRLARLPRLPEIVREDLLALGGFDAAAVREVRRLRGVRTLILGHSHGPRFLQLPGGKLFVNTGTWMKMINLDVQHLGQDSGLTYCTIEYGRGEDGEPLPDGKPRVQLKRWYGRTRPFEVLPYAD
jgi:UDP-2,3-diacylglucosamine pyrophosphatase LpxH